MHVMNGKNSSFSFSD